MFDIQNKPYFEWPRPMGEPSCQKFQIQISYHEDHGHQTENCKNLKKFLEGLVSKGHLAEYVKGSKKTKKNADDDEDDEAWQEAGRYIGYRYY